jgi:hypothetical protein
LRYDDSRAKTGEQPRNECASFHLNLSLLAGLKLLRRHAWSVFRHLAQYARLSSPSGAGRKGSRAR